MTKKRSSILDAFLGSPGADTLRRAANLLKETPVSEAGSTAKDIPKGIPKGTSKDIPLEDTKGIPKDIPKGIPLDIPKGIPKGTLDSSPIPLNTNQFVLYRILKTLDGHLTNLSLIAKETGISKHTLKANLKRLTVLGLIESRKSTPIGIQGRAISVIVKKDKQVYLAGSPQDKQNAENILSKINIHKVIIIPKDDPAVFVNPQLHPRVYPKVYPRLYPEVYPSSSSSYLNNTSTTTTKPDPPDHLLVPSCPPAHHYWSSKGVTHRLLDNWRLETGMTKEEIAQSLEHAWYHMVHLGAEENKKINDPVSYFYKTILKSGFYPPPAGFKPYEEIRAEEMARARKRREEAIKKLKEEARKEYETEKEARFWEMMNNPDSDLYKKCFSRLNNFEKKLKRGPAFESLMRRVFDELYESLS